MKEKRPNLFNLTVISLYDRQTLLSKPEISWSILIKLFSYFLNSFTIIPKNTKND